MAGQTFHFSKIFRLLRYYIFLLLTILAPDPAWSQVHIDVYKKKHICNRMLQVAEWQIDHPKYSPTDWTNGALYAGIFAAWQTTGSDRLMQHMLDWGNKNQWSLSAEAPWIADHIAVAQTYIDIYRVKGNPLYIRALLDTIARMPATTYPFKGVEVIKYWWCDALFMEPPALIKLGVTMNDTAIIRYARDRYEECYRLLFDTANDLFSRDLHYKQKGKPDDPKERNGQKIFWSRGNGWVLGGLTRILKELPKQHADRRFYVDLYTRMCHRILGLQQADGLWRSSLLDPASYSGGETSGSGFYTYAFAFGINSGLLERTEYLPAVTRAWDALNKCINDEGRLGWAQPVGADPRRNFNADNNENFAAGAYLLAASEIIRIRSLKK
jgi:unsaturated rhamnogalacturonyl hydrolase